MRQGSRISRAIDWSVATNQYNAFPLEGVRALVEFMEKFETEVKGEN